MNYYNKNFRGLGGYLSISVGLGCAVSSPAEAVISIQSFGDGMIPATLSSGVEIRIIGDPYIAMPLYGGYYLNSYGGMSVFGTESFRAADTPGVPVSFNGFFEYNYNLPAGSLDLGAELGSDNFVFFDGDNNGVAETLLHFTFDGEKGGLLLGAAVEDSGALIDFSSAVTALTVPEPSSLMLLALGSIGLASRRQRKKTA